MTKVPQDYANRFICAQPMFVALVLVMNILWALVAVIVVSIGEKMIDFRRESESVQMCMSKAIVSILGGLIPFCVCCNDSFVILATRSSGAKCKWY